MDGNKYESRIESRNKERQRKNRECDESGSLDMTWRKQKISTHKQQTPTQQEVRKRIHAQKQQPIQK